MVNAEFTIVFKPSCRMSERRFVHPKKPKLPIERTFLWIEMYSSPIQALNEESSINLRFGGSTIVRRCIQFWKQDSLILLIVSAPVKSTHSSAEQSMNVCFGNIIIFASILTRVKEVHCSNTLCSILVMLLGTCTLSREVQPSNTFLSIWYTCSAITIFSKDVHRENAHFLIFVIEFGMVIRLRDSQSMNIHSSMVSILERSTLTNFIHPRNAPDSISISPGGILILSRPLDKNA